MSTQYRDPPQWKTNAAERLEVEMFSRLNAASNLCDRFLKVAGAQLRAAQEHMDSGGDFLELLVGSKTYDEMRAEAEGSASTGSGQAGSFSGSSEKVPDPLVSSHNKGSASTGSGQAGTFSAQDAEKEPDPKPDPKRKYVPRLKAEPVYVMALRAAELQRELIPILKEFGHALLRAGVDVRRHLHEDVVAQVIRDEFGVELEELDQPTLDLMRDTIVKTNQWLREFKQKAAEEMEGESPGGEDMATDDPST